MLFRSKRERLLWSAAACYTLLIYTTLGLVRPATEALRSRGYLSITLAVIFAVAGAGALAWVIRTKPGLRTWLALCAVAAGYAAVFPFAVMPEERIHLLQYGILALLFFFALVERRRAFPAGGEVGGESSGPDPARPSFPVRHPALTSFLLTTAAGWGDELLQGLHPLRYYDIRDVAFNALAGALALSAVLIVRRSR